jgi:predicted outer membrane repeat protein
MGSSGGAVLLSHSSGVSFRECTFDSNTAASSGGAVVALESHALSLSEVAFTSNRATHAGGALATLECEGTRVIECAFTGNGGALGGALGLKGGHSALVAGSTFKSNAAQRAGAAIAMRGVAHATMDLSNTFEGNTLSSSSDTASESALYIEGGTTVYSREGDRDGAAIESQCALPAGGGGSGLGGARARAARLGESSDAGDSRAWRATFTHISVGGLPDLDSGRGRRHADDAAQPDSDRSDVFVRILGADSSSAETSVHAEVEVATSFEGESLTVLADSVSSLVLVEVLDDDERHVELLGYAYVDLRGGPGSGTFALAARRRRRREPTGDVADEPIATVTLAWTADFGSSDGAGAQTAGAGGLVAEDPPGAAIRLAGEHRTHPWHWQRAGAAFTFAARALASSAVVGLMVMALAMRRGRASPAAPAGCVPMA